MFNYVKKTLKTQVETSPVVSPIINTVLKGK